MNKRYIQVILFKLICMFLLTILFCQMLSIYYFYQKDKLIVYFLIYLDILIVISISYIIYLRNCLRDLRDLRKDEII